MANDTVTLALQGDVSLDQFAEGIVRFSALIRELSVESGVPQARWQVEDLEVGSTTATARGVANGSNGSVERVVASYLEVGRALEQGITIPFPSRVREEAVALTKLLGVGVEAIRFETADADAIIRSFEEATPTPRPPVERAAAYGAVRGRVQTLTSRNSLRFTLYDAVHDRAVSCYLAEGSQDQARDIWDKMATVEGWVSRDPESGRPLSVRRIRRVTVIEDEGEPQGYLQARGAHPRGDHPPAEVRIRRLRDAG